MTATLAAPPQTRPPHIPREWWYRATWHARQQAINNHLRATRATEPAPTDYDAIADAVRAAENQERTPVTLDTDELITLCEQLLNAHATPAELVNATGYTIGALEGRTRRAGRADLARQFARLRNTMRRKQCGEPGCTKPVWPGADRCTACRNVEAARKRRAVVIEDLLDLLTDNPTLRMDDAGKRLGYTSGNGLNKMLLRAGRHDLIDKLAANGQPNQRRAA